MGYGKLLIPLAVLPFFLTSCDLKVKHGGSVKVEEESKQPPPPDYTLTLKVPPTFAKTLLEKGYKFEYSRGFITVRLREPQKVNEVLELYGNYTEKLQRETVLRGVIAQLIKEDIARAKAAIKYWQEQFDQIAPVLTERGIKLDFSALSERVLRKEREVFESYLRYWDMKLKQLEENYGFEVEEPSINAARLVLYAQSVFGDDVKSRLFKFYLMKKLNTARLEADLYKLHEYESGR